MAAGVWPAVAMAADAPPGQVKQEGAPGADASGADTAPGQVEKDAEPVMGPVAEPVVEPVGEAAQADALDFSPAPQVHLRLVTAA